MKVCIIGSEHMTKMATMLIYDKIVQDFLLQNQTSYDLGTWHAASGTKAIHSLYSW